MVELFGALAVVLLLAAVSLAWRRASVAVRDRPDRRAWEAAGGAPGDQVVLDLAGADPALPSVERLVREAAHRALAADPDLDEVEVVDRDGRTLARERRPGPLRAEPALPAMLRVPPARSPRGPSPVPRRDVTHPRSVPEPAPQVRSVPLADRLDLPADLRGRIEDADDGTAIVHAILEAGGRQVQRDGDLLRTDDVAVAVVDVHADADRALTHGFLRIQATDAARGLVIRLGYADPSTVRRREAAAAHVRHAGPDALQRMADAVAVGADPIAFAVAPAVVPARS